MELILSLLTEYKYYLLFPLAIFEGPILAVITGFLCSTGFLNPFISYSIILAGDIVGDSLYYWLGRLGNAPRLQKLIKWLGLTPERLERVKGFIDTNPYKTISLSKIILGIGVAGLFLAGKSKLSYLRFFSICLLASSVICAGYFSLGVFFGKAAEQINQYLNYFASISIVTAIAVFIIFKIRSGLMQK